MPTRPPQAKPIKIDNPYRETRPSSTRRGYDADHRRNREIVLERDILCRVCGVNFSYHAHHLRYGPDLTPEDYWGVCESCHLELHQEEDGR